MEKRFITQDEALGFLEDFMNIPAESKKRGCMLSIVDHPDGTMEMGLSYGETVLRSLTIIHDSQSLDEKSAMKYLMDGEDSDE